ncbi:autotransporter assembly complex family protein [soil metagenome]
MRHLGQRAAVWAVLSFGAALSAAPAIAFELFGIRLWGSGDEDVVEIIDPLPYTVDFEIEPEPGDELRRSLRAASSLWSDRELPASGRAGLVARARGDYRRILAALYNAGYYGPQISIRVAGREAAEIALDIALPPEVPVEVLVRPGPRFRFGTAGIAGAPVWRQTVANGPEDPASVDFAPGRTARAGAVGAASELAVARWRELGHAKAEESGREVIADHATTELDVAIRIEPGRQARYGTTAVEGSGRVDAAFVAFMADLIEGDTFDPDDIAAGQSRLARLGVFRSIRIEEAPAIGPDGRLPMFVRVEGRPARTIGFGATLSTIDGLGLEAFWQHRNLFGRAEQLRIDASVLGLGETTDPEALTYNVGVSFVKPGVYTPDTNFVSSLVGRQEDLDAYRIRSVTGRVGIAQVFGRFLTGDVFVEASRSRVWDDFGVRDFLSLGPAVSAQYDRRDDPADASSGYWLGGEIRPFYEFEFANPALRSVVEARVYRPFGAEARFVLAGRARASSFWGPSIEESPPDQLFFAGGGGSMRGYAFRSIGVEAETNGETATVGGRSMVEASGEIRARIGESFGVVGFVDAGFVTPDSLFAGEAEWQVGTGLGLRYYTGFGPVRVDVAVPLDRRPQDSAAALYIGIGQAF